MMPNKYYTIKDLVQAFADAGLPVTALWIRRQEYKGNLKLPRSTTNFKKPLGFMSGIPPSPVRLMTQEQINKIVQAYLPGGSGCYNYLEDN